MRDRRCSTCGAMVDGHRFGPFCSERCRLVDLHGWMTERYRIPGDPMSPPQGETTDDE